MGGYLVAIDGSGASKDALRYALDLARSTGQSVAAVHVVVPEEIVAADDVPPTSFAEANRDLILSNVEDAETHGQELLEAAEATADREGMELEIGLLYGEPVQEITEYADENEYDAIFIGHRGASERYETLFGSVAKQVTGRATVPVTVVR